MNNRAHLSDADRQKRLAYMQAMDIPVWLPREIKLPEPHTTAHKVTAEPDFTEVLAQLEAQPTKTRAQTLQTTHTLPHTAHKPKAQTDTTTPALHIPQTLDNTHIAKLDWQALQATVRQCQRCGLHKTRTQTVFGVGHKQPDCLVIGEAPGLEEDKQGEPFVGRAGKLLDQMLLAISLERSAVYITNTLKCRPPYNRDPNAHETKNCQAFLKRQIALLQPKVIVVVGRIAAQNLLQNKTPLTRLRGRVHYLPLDGTPVVATYHPAYLLRYPQDKHKTWQDLQLAMRALQDEKKPVQTP